MRFETIAVVAAISVEAVEGEGALSYHLSKEAHGRKESIEAFSGPRFIFGDKVLSNDRVMRQRSEATNIQSKYARGASVEADIGVLASEQNTHRLLGRNRRLTSTVPERSFRRFLEEGSLYDGWQFTYEEYQLYEKMGEICPYARIFTTRPPTLEALSRPLAHAVEVYCSRYGDDACSTCEVTNLYEDGAISGYTISMDCADSSKDFLSPLFDACDGLGLGFGLYYNQELCAACDVDVESNLVYMRDCHIASIGYDLDTILYNKGYSGFYVDTQFFQKDPIVETANSTCSDYYYDCNFCGISFAYDPETGMPTESYDFAIDCTNQAPDPNFFEELSFLKSLCECGVCASCNVDADKRLVEFVDCNISRGTEEFFKEVNEWFANAFPEEVEGELDEDETNATPEEVGKELDEELASAISEEVDGELDEDQMNATPEEEPDASNVQYLDLRYSVEYSLPNKKIPRQSDYLELSQATGAYLKRFMLGAQENLLDFDTRIISNTILCV